jgi:(heptosyl)LPS beta-1,4-glucosyltransferase
MQARAQRELRNYFLKDMTDKIPCSVLVLTRNSAQSLERCLRPLAPFAEIVVHDANSEDNSVAIAQKFGAKIFKQYDTDEKSVRVKDFTEMRLKQRAAASYDWVLYIDSDEELSDGAVTEIGEILATADPKTIIKIPRVPVIDGVPRTRGHLVPDVMPRIHHRKSGATLRSNKTVHEKYVYDSSFKEVILHHPLYVPLPTVEELTSKDDRYILLEIERIKRDGYSWKNYIQWMLFREPLIMFTLTCRILLKLPELMRPDAIPFAHHWRYVRYHWRLYRAVTGYMLKKTFSSLR